jgi:hypothetical protein
MSKILGKNETGFGLLIETDAGYIGSDLNKDVINESFSFKENEPILINCILQKWGVKNKNGRIYPKDVLISQVNEYQKKIDDNTAVNESDHPESSNISLSNISHMIKKMWWGTGNDQNILYGQLQMIVSPGFLKYGVCSMIGDKIIVYLKNGIRLGISSRGVGTLKEIKGENVVQGDFELICFDLVSTPSTPGAYLFPNKENFTFSETIENKKDLVINESNIKIINTLDKFLL